MRISNETKVGALVTVSITILILGYNFLKGEDLFIKETKLFAVYDRIDGLGEADPVQINGLTIGRVNELSLSKAQPGKILVKFSINPKITVPEDSRAQIASSDLLGAKVIRILLGKSDSLARSGDTLASDIEGTIQEEVNKTILPLKVKTEKLLGSLDTTIQVVQYFLNEKNKENFDKSFANLEMAIRSFTNTSQRIDTLVKREAIHVNRIMSNAESITANVRRNNKKVTEILENTARVTESIAESDIQEAVKNAEKALNDFSVVMGKINSGEGSLGLLLQDDKLYKNLSDASGDLDALLKDMQDYPGKYFRIRLGKSKSEKKKEKEDKKLRRQERRQNN